MSRALHLWEHEAEFTCNACGRSARTDYVSLFDVRLPLAWNEAGDKHICASCRFDALVIAQFLGPAHIEHMPEVSA